MSDVVFNFYYVRSTVSLQQQNTDRIWYLDCKLFSPCKYNAHKNCVNIPPESPEGGCWSGGVV